MSLPIEEQWRPVAGYEGFYEVSDLGRVRSVDREFIRADGRRQFRRGRVLSPCMAGNDLQYRTVTLRFGKRAAIHVLVCTAFHGPKPTPTHEVAHGNGDPEDNRSVNLRWATRPENQQDSIRHGTKHVHRTGAMAGRRNPNARLSPQTVTDIRSRRRAGETLCALAATFGISKSQVHNITTERQWKP